MTCKLHHSDMYITNGVNKRWPYRLPLIVASMEATLIVQLGVYPDVHVTYHNDCDLQISVSLLARLSAC